MGKLILSVLLFFIISCSNSTYYRFTGHSQQSELIDRTFQHALEYNADGVIAYWMDKNTGKSGYVKPKYASYSYKGPCRHFELVHYYPDKHTQYFNGIACKRDQLWQMQ